MILVDTSVWVDHLRFHVERLAALLDDEQVLMHPFIFGELALGNFRRRGLALRALSRLPAALVARGREVLRLIDKHHLFGSGIGYVDAHLLASARLTVDAKLWTRDRRLSGVAGRMGLAANLPH